MIARRTVIGVLVAAASLTTWVAWAQIGGGGTVLGCVNSSGIIRGIDEATGSCRAGDTTLSWYTKAGADAAFLRVLAKAADADKLDGLDSTDFATAAHSHTLADLDGSSCLNPAGQSGAMEITQSPDAIAILRCRVGTGRFVENGNGTITDTQTGLMWELKVPGGGGGCGLHCVQDEYTWEEVNGDWIHRVNGRLMADENERGFAGYSDWRIPTVTELLTIHAPNNSGPSLHPAFQLFCPEFHW